MRLFIILIILIVSNTSYGQIRTQIGEEVGLGYNMGILSHGGIGITGTVEYLIKDQNSITFETGFKALESSHGYGQTSIIPVKLGYRKYIRSDAPDGVYFNIQLGTNIYSGLPITWSPKNYYVERDNIVPVAGIGFGWVNGNRARPSFNYSISNIDGKIISYTSFKLAATFQSKKKAIPNL